MEITNQLTTIGEMSLGHFQTFITDIIKRTVYEVTGPRFEAIERRLDGLENRLDALEDRLDRLDDRLDGLENRLEVVEQRLSNIDEMLTHLENKFDRYQRNNDLIGALVLKHDAKLYDVVAA